MKIKFPYFDSCWKICILFSILSAAVQAQTEEANPNYSPYNVIENFEENLSKDDYHPDQAGKSFMKNDTVKRSDLAIKLKKILDGKGLKIDLKKIPVNSDYYDSINKGYVYQPFTSEPEIYVQKVKGKWYYSEETVQNLNRLYDDLYVVKVKPKEFLTGPIWQKKIFGITLAEWMGLLALLLICSLLFTVIFKIAQFILRHYAQKKLDYDAGVEKHIAKIARVLALFIVCQVFIKYLPSLELPLNWNSWLIKLVGISAVVFMMLFLTRIIDAIAYIIKHGQHFSEKFNDQLLPIFQRILIIFAWTTGIFYILYYYMNVEPTALLAGISIGGIALALAAQDTVKNFLGSAIILIDKPFQVNDWIIYKDFEGIVEEVGIRSTRIRSFEDSIIYVPNSLLSSDVVNNNGLRKFRRFKIYLGIEYQTPPEVIDEYVKDLVKLIKEHPDTVKYNYNVYLNGLSDSSIDILFSCFFSVHDTPAELKARHEMLSNILKLSRNMNVQFAFPSRSIYMETGGNFGNSAPFTPVVEVKENKGNSNQPSL